LFGGQQAMEGDANAPDAAGPAVLPDTATTTYPPGMDIFAIAIKERDDAKEKGSDLERTVLISGSKQGGKTSMVQRFLDCMGSEAPKPTQALEYTYGRRAHQNNMGKDIVHLWELGGGTFLTDMLDSVLTKDSIGELSALIVLDLSKPNELWYTLHGLLDKIKLRLGRITGDLTAKDSRLPARLTKRAWARVGDEHPDKDLIEPFIVPLVIMGTKYDLFQKMDPIKRKVLCSTLRYIALVNGASLYFTCDRGEDKTKGTVNELLQRSKSIMNNLAFKTAVNTRGVVDDHDKPLMIAAGADSFKAIGAPQLKGEPKSGRSTPMELWRQAFEEVFPPDPKSRNTEIPEDPTGELDAQTGEKKYAEPYVDEMRVVKDEILSQYRKKSEKRAAELAKKHAGGEKGDKSSRKPQAPSGTPSKPGGSSRRGGSRKP